MSKHTAFTTDGQQPADSLAQSSLLVFSVAIVASLPFLMGGGLATLSRPLWFDELLTYTLVSDESLGHTLSAIADGVDYNPPTLHLLNRVFAWPLGGPSELSLRLFALLSVVLALAGLYLILRVAWQPLPCLVTILALNCQPLIIDQASQARFYGPWSAAVVWFAYFLIRVTRRPTLASCAALAACSLFVCSIHYFGVISLALLVGAHFCWCRQAFPARGWEIAGIVLGPLTLLALLPCYFGQRAALTVPTWVDSVSLAQIGAMSKTLVPAQQLALVASLAYLSRVFRCSSGREKKSDGLPAEERAFAGLMGLLAMPAVLLVFSWLVQPVMVPRYSVVTVFSFGPVLAWLASRIPRPLLAAALVWFCVTGAFQWMLISAAEQRHTKAREELAQAIRAYDSSIPVLFEDKLTLFPLVFYHPALRDRCHFLDFQAEQISEPNPLRIVSRDVTRSYARHYDLVRLFDISHLEDYPRVLLVPIDGDLTGRKEYQAYRIRRRGVSLYELEIPEDVTPQ